MEDLVHDSKMYTSFKAGKDHFVYDTWSNKILHIDSRMFDVLNAKSLDVFTDKAEYSNTLAELKTAQKSGLFSFKKPAIVSFPQENINTFLDKYLSKGPEQLVLGITEQCNLRCRYCAYSGLYETERVHSNKSMNSSMIKKAIDWYVAFEREEYSLGFYGGEPLLEKEKLLESIEYLSSKTDKKLVYSLTSNVTLLDDETLSFFVDNSVRLTISLDGPKMVHDRYRVFEDGKGSFDIVFDRINYIKNQYPEYYANVSFNIVMAPPYMLAEIRKFVLGYPELFSKNSIRINQMNSEHKETDLFVETDVNVYSNDHNKLYSDFCDSILDGNRVENLSNSFFQDRFLRLHKRSMAMMKDRTATHGQCVPGQRKCYVDTDGRFHMCERVNDAFPIGHVSSGYDYKVIADFLKSYDDFFKEDCSKCWALRFCGKCYNNFKSVNGWSADNIKDYCNSKRRDIKNTIAEYCRLRQYNENCFDWIDDVVVS